jgi:hypothetical protein
LIYTYTTLLCCTEAIKKCIESSHIFWRHIVEGYAVNRGIVLAPIVLERLGPVGIEGRLLSKIVTSRSIMIIPDAIVFVGGSIRRDVHFTK